MESGSVFSFTTTRGHTTHISLLWLFVLFSFLCVAVVLLAGYQDGLKVREFGDVDVNGKLTVDGEQDFNGFRTKTYTQTYTRTAARSNADDSLGPIATGFSTGHYVTQTSLSVTEATAADLDAITIELANEAGAAFDGVGGTAITGAATLANSNALGSTAGFGTTGTKFVTGASNSNSVCLASAVVDAMGATGVIVASVTVVAGPGSPALP